MKPPEIRGVVWCGALAWSISLTASQTPTVPAAAELNVNSRYIIESIQVSGSGNRTLSQAVMDQIEALTGQLFSQPALDDLVRRIRADLRASAVTQSVTRGSQPDSVKVTLEAKRHTLSFEANVPHFVYHAKQGWSGGAEAATQFGNNKVSFGLRSDGDELVERFAGLNFRYENRCLGVDRLGLRFDLESYHQQWNQSTLDSLASSRGVAGVYRTRHSFAPALTIALAKPLTLSVGTAFGRLETQFPAARNVSANAVVTSLRYIRRADDSNSNKLDLGASYDLRAAASSLGSDFAYTRHYADFGYRLRRGRHTSVLRFGAGLLTGRAPLFERFVLGNSTTLRGWNKWAIDPTGGNRVIHNTVEYHYRVFQVFYDTGAVWSKGEQAVARHSLGVGLRKSVFALAVAFPVKEGRVEPLFMVGMNY